MKILIDADADACPVLDIAIRLAKGHSISCVLICDTSHYFESDYEEVITVSKDWTVWILL